MYETRLLRLKGARSVRVSTLPLQASSLNSGDVFILDLGLKLIQWNGAEANKKEKAKALDVCLSILRVLHDGLGQDKYAPCPLLVNMVTAGKLGAKSGEGFYIHTRGSKDLVVAPRSRNKSHSA